MITEKDIYGRLEELGLVLPPPPRGLDTFQLVQPMTDDLLYLSGLGPAIPNQTELSGKVGAELDIAQGQQAAHCTILNALALLQEYLGDLNRVTGFVKLLVFVASDPGFYDQPLVANGASQLLIDVFGEQVGKSARSAIGVAVLPKDIPVEIEMIVRYR